MMIRLIAEPTKYPFERGIISEMAHLGSVLQMFLEILIVPCERHRRRQSLQSFGKGPVLLMNSGEFLFLGRSVERLVEAIGGIKMFFRILVHGLSSGLERGHTCRAHEAGRGLGLLGGVRGSSVIGKPVGPDLSAEGAKTAKVAYRQAFFIFGYLLVGSIFVMLNIECELTLETGVPRSCMVTYIDQVLCVGLLSVDTQRCVPQKLYNFGIMHAKFAVAQIDWLNDDDVLFVHYFILLTSQI